MQEHIRRKRNDTVEEAAAPKTNKKDIHSPSGTKHLYTRKRTSEEIVDAAAAQRAGESMQVPATKTQDATAKNPDEMVDEVPQLQVSAQATVAPKSQTEERVNKAPKLLQAMEDTAEQHQEKTVEVTKPKNIQKIDRREEQDPGPNQSGGEESGSQQKKGATSYRFRWPAWIASRLKPSP